VRRLLLTKQSSFFFLFLSSFPLLTFQPSLLFLSSLWSKSLRAGCYDHPFGTSASPIPVSSPIMASDGPAAMPVTPIKSASDISYPNGHLGHLNSQQEQAFERFKSVLADRGLYKPGPPPSHDDPLLL
jgi:hypothetical protein